MWENLADTSDPSVMPGHSVCVCVLAICLSNHCTLCLVFPRAHNIKFWQGLPLIYDSRSSLLLFKNYYIWIRKLPMKTPFFSLHLIASHPQWWNVSSSEENVFKHFNISVPTCHDRSPEILSSLLTSKNSLTVSNSHPSSILATLKCSISRNIQGQSELSAELPGMIVDVPAHCRVFEIDAL